MTAAHLRAPPAPLTPLLRCWAKVPYVGRKEAIAVLRRGLNGRSVVGEPYHCRHCGNWHITSGREWAGVGRK